MFHAFILLSSKLKTDRYVFLVTVSEFEGLTQILIRKYNILLSQYPIFSVQKSLSFVLEIN
jgi:hypothetical protein